MFLKAGVLQFEGRRFFRIFSWMASERTQNAFAHFEAAWARLQSDEPGWPLDAADRLFHDSLLQWLKFQSGAMLIGELVPEVLRSVRNNPASPELAAFDHVIVDEYQDLNRSDQVLLDYLTSENGVIIGDENQSIYRFRHAPPRGNQRVWRNA